MSTINTAEGFETLCRQTAEKWKVHDFPGLPGSSGNALTKFWTTQNMQNVAARERKAAVGNAAAYGALGSFLAVAAVPLIATFAPIIVAFAGSAAAIAATTKLVQSHLRSNYVKSQDIKNMQKAIPSMQDDLVTLLDASKMVARELSQEHDKQGVQQVRESLEAFLETEMAINPDPDALQLDELLPDRKGQYDFTGLHLSKKALDEVSSIEKRTQAVAPQGRGLGKEIGRGHDVSPKVTKTYRPPEAERGGFDR